MLLLAYSSFKQRDADARRRCALAQSTWRTQPWRLFPIADESLPRLFAEGSRRFPYVVDILDAAVTGTPDETIIVYLNSDIGVTSDCAIKIVAAMQRNDATYCFRRDAHHRLTAAPTDAEILGWHDYAGTDLFAFRSHWWREYRKQMPDMVVARESWDACLRVLIEATCPNKPVAVENVCWHERHSAGVNGNDYWETPRNRYTLAGQKHNLRLARSFLPRYGYRPAQFGIR